MKDGPESRRNTHSCLGWSDRSAGTFPPCRRGGRVAGGHMHTCTCSSVSDVLMHVCSTSKSRKRQLLHQSEATSCFSQLITTAGRLIRAGWGQTRSLIGAEVIPRVCHASRLLSVPENQRHLSSDCVTWTPHHHHPRPTTNRVVFLQLNSKELISTRGKKA